MQVGDLVKCLIVENQPTGIITRVERSNRWVVLYRVTSFQVISDFPFRKHQLEVISANR